MTDPSRRTRKAKGMGLTQALWILIAISLGGTSALQVALLGAMSRSRGPYEAAFTSIVGTLFGLSVALCLRTVLGGRLALPHPFGNPVVTGAIGAATGVVLVAALRGIPGWFAITGMLAVPYLIAASFLAPRLGVGLFLAAVITGQLGGAVLLDHLGAFGATPRPADPIRLLGVVALLVGVVLVRGIR